MTSVAAVIVTHDAQRWLEPLLASIEGQSRRLDRVVVIDDGSTDDTLAIAAGHGITPVASTSTAGDPRQRTAENFVQGVRACADIDIVVLGDHDDVWHADRVERQATLLEQSPDALMVASDGRLVDADGRPAGGTLRGVFPVPADWPVLAPEERMRQALRRSVATGGASALRPSLFPDLAVPPSWLHDRWWSLVATARAGMLVDTGAVIDYRVTAEQQVGLDRGTQAAGDSARAAAWLRRGPEALQRLADLRRLRGMAATPSIAGVINARNVLRT